MVVEQLAAKGRDCEAEASRLWRERRGEARRVILRGPSDRESRWRSLEMRWQRERVSARAKERHKSRLDVAVEGSCAG